MLALEARLPEILAGTMKPASAMESHPARRTVPDQEALPGGRSALRRRLRGLTGGSREPDRPPARHAAGAAALAGCDGDPSRPGPTDEERARWRKQALDWLRADLKVWGKTLDGGKTENRELVTQTLHTWRNDPTLAGLRDPAARQNSPRASARSSWRFGPRWTPSSPGPRNDGALCPAPTRPTDGRRPTGDGRARADARLRADPGGGVPRLPRAAAAGPRAVAAVRRDGRPGRRPVPGARDRPRGRRPPADSRATRWRASWAAAAWASSTGPGTCGSTGPSP